MLKLVKKCGVAALRLVLSLVLLACNYIEQAIIDSAIVQSESKELSTNQQTVSSQYPSQLEIVDAQLIKDSQTVDRHQSNPQATIDPTQKVDPMSRRRSGQIGVAAHKSETVYESEVDQGQIESEAETEGQPRSGQIGPKRHKSEYEIEVENGNETQPKKGAEAKQKKETKPKKEIKPKTKSKKNIKKEPKTNVPQIKILPPSSGPNPISRKLPPIIAADRGQTAMENGVMLLRNRLQKEKEALIQIRNRQLMFKYQNDQVVDQ